MTEETQTTEGKSNSLGWVGAVAVMALVAVLAAVIVFPGFVAGWLSRPGGHSIYAEDERRWGTGSGTALSRVTQVVLYPSGKLMERSATVCKFYVWEYKCAGGIVSHRFIML